MSRTEQRNKSQERMYVRQICCQKQHPPKTIYPLHIKEDIGFDKPAQRQRGRSCKTARRLPTEAIRNLKRTSSFQHCDFACTNHEQHKHDTDTVADGHSRDERDVFRMGHLVDNTACHPVKRQAAVFLGMRAHTLELKLVEGAGARHWPNSARHLQIEAASFVHCLHCLETTQSGGRARERKQVGVDDDVHPALDVDRHLFPCEYEAEERPKCVHCHVQLDVQVDGAGARSGEHRTWNLDR
mmetsp:Transcript_71616/g.180852  ORF Transcript_71616/g.180852 Transcript_71616/m.180852 type:complete len:241 (-) Transcript_71616:428-1150(-)